MQKINHCGKIILSVITPLLIFQLSIPLSAAHAQGEIPSPTLEVFAETATPILVDTPTVLVEQSQPTNEADVEPILTPTEIPIDGNEPLPTQIETETHLFTPIPSDPTAIDLNAPCGSLVVINPTGYPPNPLIIEARVFDAESGIRKVDFFTASVELSDERILIGSVTSEPYQILWDWSEYTNHVMLISAEATDNAGNTVLLEDIIQVDLKREAIISAFAEVKPGLPTLIFPASSALINGLDVTLDWSDSSPGAHHYELMFSDNPQFDPLISNPIDLMLSNQPISSLTANTTYYWKVRAVNLGGLTSSWTSTRSFRTRLPAPVLTDPEEAEETTSLRPTFNWDAVTGASGYTLQIASNSSFTQGLLTFTTASTSFTPSVNLVRNTTLFWRVMAKGTNPSNYSTVRSFLSANPAPVPVLVSPASKALIDGYTPTLTWTAGTGTISAISYDLEIATNPSFSTDEQLIPISPLSTSYSFSSELAENTTWYWHVRSINADNEISQWSSYRTFRTKMLPPVLETPAQDAESLTIRPNFTWQTVSGASSYTLQVAADDLFTLKLKTFTCYGNSYTPAVDLPRNIRLFWRVKANGANTSNYSSTMSFINADPPGVPILVAPSSGILLEGYKPTLTWKAGVGIITVTGYELQIASNSLFSADTQIIDISDAITTYTFGSDLPSNKTWYWHVRALNVDNEYSIWSATRTFRTRMLPPGLTTPMEGGTAMTIRPEFIWEPIAGAKNYTLQISSDESFLIGLKTFTTGSSSLYTPTVNLARNTLLYWRVRANGTNPSYFTLPQSFHTPNPPGIPNLKNPASGTLLSGLSMPEFEWIDGQDSIIKQDHYEMQISINPQFSPLEQQKDCPYSTCKPDNLGPNTTWYWRVRSVAGDGSYSIWSAVRTIRTKLLTPDLVNPPDKEVESTVRPTFSWNTVLGAGSYTLQLSTSSSFSTIYRAYTISGSTVFTPGSDLPHNTKLYWRVKANGTNPSDWSPYRCFTTPL